MLSTGRLLCARRIRLDVKFIEGAKCSFHVCSFTNATKIRSHVLYRKLLPVSSGGINFVSSDASAPQSGGNLDSTLLEENNPDLEILRELGILPSQQTSNHSNVEEISADNAVEFSSPPFVIEESGSTEVWNIPTEYDVTADNIELAPNAVDFITSEELSEPATFVDSTGNTQIDQPSCAVGSNEAGYNSPTVTEFTTSADTPVISPEVASTVLPSDVITDVAVSAGFTGEPTLASIGLGNYTPVGMVQRSLEFFHITLDLPWWGSIALGTLIIRLLIFPLVIMGQRNAAKMNNHLPEMQALQLKMSEARQRGDKLDAALHAHELVQFMGKKGVNPFKNSIVPLCQAPFFISMFMGIRAMANAPVESFHQGGLAWFTDLTVPDEFYLLPIITSATLALTIEVGTDMGKLHSMGMARYLLRGIPLIVLPFTFNFPAGVLVYWVSTNFISLVQVAVLRAPKVRDYFNIDQMVKFDKKALPIQQKGFVGGIKESWTNLKISRELQDRERIDNANFLRAGRGAVKKTYKFDPTQPQTARKMSPIGVQVKSRDS